jgi:hypothetical protein
VADITTDTVVVTVPATLMQNVLAHLSQPDTESEQTSSSLQAGQEPVKASGHTTQRLNMSFGTKGLYAVIM